MAQVLHRYIGRTVYDCESKCFGEVCRAIDNGRRILVDVYWDDQSTSSCIDLRAFHVWDSGYSFV